MTASDAFVPIPAPEAIPTVAGEIELRRAKDAIALTSLRGSVVILALISAHCKKCLDCAAALKKVAESSHGRGLQIFAIALNPVAYEALSEFCEQRQIGCPASFMTLQEFREALHLPADLTLYYPTIAFIDRHGNVSGVFVAGDPFFENLDKNMQDSADSLLSGTLEANS